MKKHYLYMAAGGLLLVPLTPLLGMPAPPFAFSQEATSTVAAPDAVIRDKRPIIRPDQVKFGAYDPHGDFTDEANVDVEHLFLPWEDVDLSTLAAADAYALARHRKLLITIEPWSWDVNWRLSTEELRQKVLSGGYDGNIKAIAVAIKSLQSPVIVRFAQEMEDVTTARFTWQGWSPKDYITAYKHVIDIIRKERPDVKAMWSPKGLEGLAAYYPGDNYVDLIGLSVFGLEAYDKLEYGKPKTFVETLEPEYNRVVGFNKPIWVAELGYEGSAKYMQPWIQTVTEANAKFPELKEVVYFNDKDVHPWPYNLGKPDWRVVRNVTN